MSRLLLTDADFLSAEREYCQRNLANYVRQAWHIVEPAMPYVHGWHIDAICEHLEAITHGEITRLIINVPPGMMKSLLVNVFWPTWEMGPGGCAWVRHLGASYDNRLAVRDNVRARRLIESQWFQELWPTPLVKDQNEKMKWETVETGFRQVLPITSLTGNRGNRMTLDDPHSVVGGESVQQRNATVNTFMESATSRLNDVKRDAILVIMQRLNEADLTGEIIDRELGYEHLMLPMEFEADRRCITCIGFEDPRTEDGELLFPERFPRDVVDAEKRVMGSYAVAGQFQQRPEPRQGGMFPVENFKVVDELPHAEQSAVRYWDKAGTDGGGAYTAGVRMARLINGAYAVTDVERGQWSAGKREKIIKATADRDGIQTRIWFEQEPGSGGKESAENTLRNLKGYAARADRVSGQGSKEKRADPWAAYVENNPVLLLRGAWNQALIDEHRTFPAGKYKDQVDAAAGAFVKLSGFERKSRTWGRK